jgi:hypothetical protein
MNLPLAITLEFHFSTTLFTWRRLDLRTGVSPIHQLDQRFSHQLASALARFRFDLSKTGLWVRIVPFFQFIVHSFGFFHKCRLASDA